MPTSSSVALSNRRWPDSPLGIIQFHGAFLFGSCPRRHYSPLLNELHDRGYPSVLHQFPLNPFQSNHWSVALQLLKGRQEVVDQIRSVHGDSAADFFDDPANSCWLGHSLGAKFLLLLEILSLSKGSLQDVLSQSLGPTEANSVLTDIENLGETPSVMNQPTVLLAPEISNTVRLFKSEWQLDLGRSLPNMQAMKKLLLNTPNRFNLADVIEFNSDRIAADDVRFLRTWLQETGKEPSSDNNLPGGHFTPLALQIESLADAITSNFSRLRLRLGP